MCAVLMQMHFLQTKLCWQQRGPRPHTTPSLMVHHMFLWVQGPIFWRPKLFITFPIYEKLASTENSSPGSKYRSSAMWIRKQSHTHASSVHWCTSCNLSGWNASFFRKLWIVLLGTVSPTEWLHSTPLHLHQHHSVYILFSTFVVWHPVLLFVLTYSTFTPSNTTFISKYFLFTLTLATYVSTLSAP